MACVEYTLESVKCPTRCDVIATIRYVRESGGHSQRTVQLRVINSSLSLSTRLIWLLNGRAKLSGGLGTNLRKLGDDD